MDSGIIYYDLPKVDPNIDFPGARCESSPKREQLGAKVWERSGQGALNPKP